MDVVFDGYIRQTSIKSITKISNERPIRKVIDSKDVRLPRICSQLIALGENIVNLAELNSNVKKRFSEVSFLKEYDTSAF